MSNPKSAKMREGLHALLKTRTKKFLVFQSDVHAFKLCVGDNKPFPFAFALRYNISLSLDSMPTHSWISENIFSILRKHADSFQYFSIPDVIDTEQLVVFTRGSDCAPQSTDEKVNQWKRTHLISFRKLCCLLLCIATWCSSFHERINEQFDCAIRKNI